MPYPCIQKQGDFKERQGEEINNLRIIAKKELREEAHTREQCLTLFREWIERNQDIENCITGIIASKIRNKKNVFLYWFWYIFNRVDDVFLLRFLRSKKFSLPMAQQMLLKYLNFRKVFKRVCHDMDYRDNMVADLIDKGWLIIVKILQDILIKLCKNFRFLFVSPFRDSSGRRVVVCIPRKQFYLL